MDEEVFNKLIEKFNEDKTFNTSQFGGDLIFSAAQFDALFKLIKESEDVKEINLDWVHLDDEQAKKLADAITGKEKLENLMLGRNHIGDEGAIALAQAVSTTTALLRLAIFNNRIGEAGIIALAEVITDHPSFQAVNLACNTITSEKAIAALVKMIEGNLKGPKKLNEITLTNCNISLEAAMPFINMVDGLLKDGTSPEEIPNIAISVQANARIVLLLEYAKTVAGPLFAFNAAGSKSQKSYIPAKNFVDRDGNKAMQHKIRDLLGEKPKPPTPN